MSKQIRLSKKTPKVKTESLKTTSPPQKFLDENTLYVDTGVATTGQLSECIKQAIQNAEKILGRELKCRYKVNLLVGRDGSYFGYAFVWVSSSEIYWMLLGRNPDGSERFEEYPDPDWKPPTSPAKPSDFKTNWIDVVEEEDRYTCPLLRRDLPPLVEVPGYVYNNEQRTHLEELAEGQPVPEMGYFVMSRGYALDSPAGTLSHRLCARHVPEWIPLEVFKSIFSFRTTNSDYPKVNFVNSKKGGRIVFINFDPKTKDGIFTLLMTRKTVIVNPADQSQRAVLVFSHAYDNRK
jgi:hypothetical protein